MAHVITPGRYCVIDIGTVTCRMLIADVAISSECTASANAKSQAQAISCDNTDATDCVPCEQNRSDEAPKATIERSSNAATLSQTDEGIADAKAAKQQTLENLRSNTNSYAYLPSVPSPSPLQKIVVDGYSDVRIIPVAKEYKVVNLGEGVDATGMLSSAAIERVRLALMDYLAIRAALDTAEQPILKTVCFATSASRDAQNAVDFAKMTGALGLDVQIIAGAREAALSYLGAGLSASTDAKSMIAVVDIGGGSCEISVGHAGCEPEFLHSFDIGCRRVTERFFADDPPTSAQYAAANRWILTELESVFGGGRAKCDGGASHEDDSYAVGGADANNAWDFMQTCKNYPCVEDQPFASLELAPEEVGACTCTFPTFDVDYSDLEMIAVAGTATSVVTVRDAIAIYDSSLVNGAHVSRIDLDAVAARLMAMDANARARVVGLDPGRTPVIVAGLLILGCVMDVLGVDEFCASDNDILEGAALCAAGW